MICNARILFQLHFRMMTRVSEKWSILDKATRIEVMIHRTSKERMRVLQLLDGMIKNLNSILLREQRV